MLKESLLAAALAMPAWHGDKESEADRSARLTVIAQAIDEAVAIATCRSSQTKRTQTESERAKVESPAAQTEGPQGKAKPESVKPVAQAKPEPSVPVASPAAPVASPAPSEGAVTPAQRRAPQTEGMDKAGGTRATTEDSPCKRIWAGTGRELGFLLLAQAFFETRLALHVHQGNCRKEIGECDSGRAISLWQLHAGYRLPVERWRELSGTDLESTRAAALEAARALARSRNFCGTTEGAVANYATGKSCVWKPAEERLKFAEKLTDKYWRSQRARAVSPPSPALPGS